MADKEDNVTKKIKKAENKKAGGRSRNEERAEREEDMAAAVAMKISAPTEVEHAYWGLEVDRLRALLSTTAARRAQRRGERLAESKPPGWQAASEAIDTFERIAKRHGVPSLDRDTLWGSVCTIAMYQLGASLGPFHDAAARYGLVAGRLGEVIRREMSRSRDRKVEDYN